VKSFNKGVISLREEVGNAASGPVITPDWAAIYIVGQKIRKCQEMAQ
jgi:hypothetical protein